MPPSTCPLRRNTSIPVSGASHPNLAFDPVKVFGKMSGSNYSPMVTKQMALDSFLCMGFIILNLVMLCYEMKVLKEDSVAAFAWVHGDTQKVALEDLL